MTIPTPIFNMFGRSPLTPMQTHMNKVTACAEELLVFFGAVFSQDWNSAETHQAHISELEREADVLKRDLRIHLPKGLFLPVPRSDLLEMLIVQDQIANKAKDISGLVLGRKMDFPKPIATLYLPFLQKCLAAIAQANKAINELDELLETGFRGMEAKLVEEMVVELDALEHETDEMQKDLRHTLFRLEAELPPVNTIFLYKIIEKTGELADKAQVVGGELILLIAR